jgi:hypothetical protein
MKAPPHIMGKSSVSVEGDLRQREDSFSASLHALSLRIPKVGQAIVDAISERSGIPETQFLEAALHPPGNVASKPDFLLRCRDYDVLCEHKLYSDLGNRQLERYLAIESRRQTYLALITNRNHKISKEVIANERYLRPTGTPAPYFLWEMLYQSISRIADPAVRDFLVQMEALAMAPLDGTWGSLFTNFSTAEYLAECSKEMRSFLKGHGASCKPSPSRLGLEVKRLIPWLTLLYFDVARTTIPATQLINGPYMTAYVWVNARDADDFLHKFGTGENLNAGFGQIVGVGVDEKARWNKELRLVYMYVARLGDLLSETRSITERNIVSFAEIVLQHVSYLRK